MITPIFVINNRKAADAVVEHFLRCFDDRCHRRYGDDLNRHQVASLLVFMTLLARLGKSPKRSGKSGFEFPLTACAT